jgi:hypothetical protein
VKDKTEEKSVFSRILPFAHKITEFVAGKRIICKFAEKK